MLNEYKIRNDEIHAPADLLARTRLVMEKEEKTIQFHKTVKVLSAVACLVLVLAGGFFYMGRDVITPQELAKAEQDMDLGMNLGKIEQGNEDAIQIETDSSKAVAPDEVWAVKTSRISTVQIHLAKEESNWYAAWEKAGTYYYMTGQDMEEKEFIDSLKKYLKNL